MGGGLRSRLAVRAALAAAAALGAVVLVADFVLVRPMAGDSGDLLRARLDDLAAVVGEGGEEAFGRRAADWLRAGHADFAELRTAKGGVLAAVGRPVATGSPDFPDGAIREVEDPVAGRFLVLGKTVTVAGGKTLRIVAGVSVEEVRDRQASLRALLLATAAAGVLLVGTGAWFGTGLVLDPIRSLTAAAGTMGAEPAGKRLPVRDPGDEFDDLARLLNGLLARIEGSLEEERRFAGEAAHELRSPLALLRLRAEQALASRDPAAMAAALEGALADAERIHRLVQALLELSRAGGSAAGPAGPVDAAAVLGGMEEDFRTLAATRGLAFRYSGPPAAARAATGREVLETCVSVLVDNALRYTPRGGTVTLEAADEQGRLRVRVRDSGPGVPAAEAELVFDRMFRGSAGKESGAGFGLGLTLARRLARSSGGDVLLENPGQPGACFMVNLPLA